MKSLRKNVGMRAVDLLLVLILALAICLPTRTVEAKNTKTGKDSVRTVTKNERKSSESFKWTLDGKEVPQPQDLGPELFEDLPEPPDTLPEAAKYPICGPDSVGQRYVALKYGDKVTIEPGTAYYESAAFGGSGKTGTIGNEYTQGALYVGGFSVIDDVGTVMRNEVYSREEAMQSHDFQPDFFRLAYADLAWVAIFTDGFTTGDVGWLPRSAVKLDTLTTPDISDPASLHEEAQSKGNDEWEAANPGESEDEGQSDQKTQEEESNSDSTSQPVAPPEPPTVPEPPMPDPGPSR